MLQRSSRYAEEVTQLLTDSLTQRETSQVLADDEALALKVSPGVRQRSLRVWSGRVEGCAPLEARFTCCGLSAQVDACVATLESAEVVTPAACAAEDQATEAESEMAAAQLITVPAT